MSLRVLFISDFNVSPAMTQSERMMLLGLKSSGVDLTVVTHYPNEETLELEASGICFYYLNLQKKISLNAIIKLRRLLKEKKFDILHFTFGKAATNALIASRGVKIKIIAYYGSMSLHWYDPSAYLGFLNYRIDHFICVSHAVAQHVSRQLSGHKKDCVTVIPRGFDVQWLRTLVPINRKELNIPEDAFIVCSVAIVRRVKGMPFLIKATQKLPPGLPVYFLLVGDDTDSCKIRREVSSSPYKENFRLIGKVPFAPVYIAACDLYIQPSLHEGLGRALAEAMSLGKIVVATEGGGTNELITKDIDGFILPIKSPDAIAGIITSALNNRESIRLMGEKAKLKVETEFPIADSIEKTYRLYCEITGLS